MGKSGRRKGMSGKPARKADGADALLLARQRVHHSAWCARHPEKAAELRRLRLQNREAEERWGARGAGTPATHARAAQMRQGAIARLYHSGAITAEQVGSALEIAAAAERIGAEVKVRTISLETRIDGGRRDGSFWEALGQVRSEIAYTRWRAALIPLCSGARGDHAPVAVVLDMIVHDSGVTAAAALHRVHVRRARRLLSEALDLWPGIMGECVRTVDAQDLEAAHRRVA